MHPSTFPAHPSTGPRRSVRLLPLAAVVIIALAACSGTGGTVGQAPGAPSGTAASDASQHDAGSLTYAVSSLTRDGTEVPTGSWRAVSIDSLDGGTLMPTGVCNAPSFTFQPRDDGTWTVEKAGTETTEGCGQEGQALKKLAIEVLEGNPLVGRTETALVLTNAPYVLELSLAR